MIMKQIIGLCTNCDQLEKIHIYTLLLTNNDDRVNKEPQVDGFRLKNRLSHYFSGVRREINDTMGIRSKISQIRC